MNFGGPSDTLLGKIAEGVPVQNAGLMYIAGQQQRQSNVDRILKSVLEISKYDAAGATKILAEEAKNYPELEKFQNIQFRDETKNDWITASIGNGQTMMINIQTIGKIAKDPANKDKYLKEEALILGTPKVEKEPKTIGNINVGDFTPQSVQKFNETGNYSDLVPALKPKKDTEESRTTNMKELDFTNQQRKQQGLPELSFEEYMQRKYELNDPTGMKALMRNEITGGIPTEKGTAAVQKKAGEIFQKNVPQTGQITQELPIAALDALKKSNGQPVTFQNGQVWQWINGQAKRIR